MAADRAPDDLPRPSPGAPTLVLVPSTLERDRLRALGGLDLGLGPLVVCGVGPVAAGVEAARWLEQRRPRRVLLLGVAGTFDPERAPVGTARTFARVALEGVGYGEGADAGGPRDLGLPQWGERRDPGAVWDALRLEAPGGTDGDDALLLTVCAASAGAVQAARRRARTTPEGAPDAPLAEDMEAFAVALACRRARTPLTVVRGLSNPVGERDPAAWDLDGALAAARTRALELLRRPPAGHACVPHPPATSPAAPPTTEPAP